MECRVASDCDPWVTRAVETAAALAKTKLAISSADGVSGSKGTVSLTIEGETISGAAAVVGYLLDAGGVSVSLQLPAVQHWLAWAQGEPESLAALEAAVAANTFLTGSCCTAADIVTAAWVAGSAAGSTLSATAKAWVASVIGAAPVAASAKQARAPKQAAAKGAGKGAKPKGAKPKGAGKGAKPKGGGGGGGKQKAAAEAKAPAAPTPKKAWDRGFGAVGPQYYVTTAINYTNGLPHCGHAYEGVTADVLARYHRNYGRDTFFMTGTDEHGKKIALTAEKESIKGGDPTGMKVKPIDICDRYSGLFQKLNARVKVEPDFFIRTTMDMHKKNAQQLWKKCRDNGDIYLDRYEGWYNVKEEEFVTDADAEACQFKDASGGPLERMAEESYFFRMSKYADALIAKIKSDEFKIRPVGKKNQILARLTDPESPLRDLSVSRATFSWGVPVPDSEKHVMYVWFDALSNYTSGVDLFGGGPKAKYWPAQCHIIGKDILWFHCVIWPCMLLSAGIALPKQVFGHGFVMDKNGEKMSKSVGNVVDPNEMLDKYAPDIFRYFLVKQAPYGNDIKFSEGDLIAANNSELANTLGNLVNRATNLTTKFCKGVVPSLVCTDRPFDVATVVATVEENFANYELQTAVMTAMGAIRNLNEYFTETEPWKLKGDEHDEARQRIVKTVLEGVYVCAHLLEPFIPNTGAAIFEQLGTEKRPIVKLSTEFDNLAGGTVVTKGAILFPQLDAKELITEKAPPAAADAAAAASPEAVAAVLAKHNAQGAVVADLKKAKAPKAEIDAAVAVLLGCKKEYQDLTGKKVPRADTGGGSKKKKAAPAAAAATAAPAGGADAGGAKAEILARHGAQGAVVGGLKKAKADKADITAAVAVLLAIKEEYKALTGEDVPRADAGGKKKKKK